MASRAVVSQQKFDSVPAITSVSISRAAKQRCLRGIERREHLESPPTLQDTLDHYLGECYDMAHGRPPPRQPWRTTNFNAVDSFPFTPPSIGHDEPTAMT